MRQRIKQFVSIWFIVFIVLSSPVGAQGERDSLIIRYFNLEVENQENLPPHIDPDVTSGDVILITTPEGQNLLIDATVPHLGTALQTRLEELGVTRLDYAFATHPHVDHIGGYLTLLKTMEIGTFYQIHVPYESSSYYRQLQQLIKDRDIQIQYLEQGDILQIGEDITLEVLNPPKGTSPETIPPLENLSTAVVNDLSLVMRLDFGEFSMLFCGDIYMGREMELLDQYEPEKLKVDILDVPHHGCISSSSTLFIATTNPQYAIMSMDGVCSMDVYNKYGRFGVEVLVTGYNGEITIVSDGKEFTITTERDYVSR